MELGEIIRSWLGNPPLVIYSDIKLHEEVPYDFCRYFGQQRRWNCAAMKAAGEPTNLCIPVNIEYSLNGNSTGSFFFYYLLAPQQWAQMEKETKVT